MTSTEESDKIITRAIGEELRRARENLGWSRTEFVARLPSGIGDRTLLAYEHGLRQLTVTRLVELCHALGIGAPSLLGQALQKAQVYLQHLVLQIDLRRLLDDTTEQRFRPMLQWARTRLSQEPNGVVEVTPSAIRELAAFVDCSHDDLTTYLSRFTPDATSS
ncbi:helix-turn-helix domain-containing protein [Actinophytocola sp. NPDC049390]|uniref:helix-turn-helix domain-containing protein n=1 Tax=Actinophytocola sp. NPDC049390 TaxID=3363894 RepID=UPI0037873854